MSVVHFDQARRERGVGGGKLPRAPRRLRASPSLKNIKYTRMHHIKKNQKFFPEGPRKNVSDNLEASCYTNYNSVK